MKQLLFIISLALVSLTLIFVSCTVDRTGPTRSVHPTGWEDPSSENFHGQLAACESCHGTQYATNAVNVSCRNCHIAPPSENLVTCGTCHALPPVSDAGLPDGMATGANAFGAHDYHVNTKAYTCTECHRKGLDNNIAHVDSLPCDLFFGPTSVARARGYVPTFEHLGAVNSGNATCAVYCHSNGRGGSPNDPLPEWTDAGADLLCTSCHSIPPVAPHPQVQQCHNCHSNVSSGSVYPNDIRFINDLLHVNGNVDL